MNIYKILLYIFFLAMFYMNLKQDKGTHRDVVLIVTISLMVCVVKA